MLDYNAHKRLATTLGPVELTLEASPELSSHLTLDDDNAPHPILLAQYLANESGLVYILVPKFPFVREL